MIDHLRDHIIVCGHGPLAGADRVVTPYELRGAVV
jgi:hypothetical protein